MSGLQVTISPSAPTSQPITLPINIAISNPTTHPITFLNWDTPFDPRADILGVFQINDTNTDTSLQLDTIKFSRALPPSKDDLVEVPAEGSVEKTVTLPHVPLEQGHEYAVRAKGIWHGLWECRKDDVTSSHLEDVKGARGEFESKRAVFKF